MAAPLTQNQLPLDAILDIFGKQTYLGNTFTLPNAGTSLTDGTETPLVVIRNPSTNTKSLFVFDRKVSTNNNPVTVKMYKNCTINSAGSATTPVNLRLGSTTASIAQCYLGATITANGTLMTAVPGTIYGLRSDLLVVIDPGTNILLTGTQVGAGTTLVIAGNAWYEL
jgi:hypothetical protein